MSVFKTLSNLVFHLDIEETLQWKMKNSDLFVEDHEDDITNDVSLYHDLVRGLQHHPHSWRQARRLVYLLNSIGTNINKPNELGDTPLHIYLTSPTINLFVLEAMLQCNADMYVTNNDGRTPLMLGLLRGGFSGEVRDVLMKYAPGLERAIESDDIMNVRKLINQGCSVRGLLQKTKSSPSEKIVQLVSDIAPSMAVLHSSMSGDTESVRDVLHSTRPFNINLRNMGHYGCTPLYYAMCTNQTPLVDLLLAHSARLDIALTINGEDMPMLVKALSSHAISSDMMTHVISQMSPKVLANISHQGDGILEAGMKAGITPELFRHILVRGGAQLVTPINSDNRSIREQAEDCDMTSYVSVIDEVVEDWCLTPSDTAQRRHLSLRGYRHFPQTAGDNLPSEVADFFHQLSSYEDCVHDFHEAVLHGDARTVQQNIVCVQFSKHFDPCLADSCSRANGQPALHKSILGGHRDLVRLLGEAILYLKGEHIDSVRDQYGRTGLHYAMAQHGGDDVVKMLQQLGASDFSVDKNGETPLGFRDRKQQPLMQQLLRHHVSQDWSRPEPNPWSEALPPPIVSYLTQHRRSMDSHKSVMDSLTALTYHTHGHSPTPPLQLTNGEFNHAANSSSESQRRTLPKRTTTRKNTTKDTRTDANDEELHRNEIQSRVQDSSNCESEIDKAMETLSWRVHAKQAGTDSANESDSSISEADYDPSRDWLGTINSWCSIT